MITNLAPWGERKELSFGNGTLQVFFYTIFAFLFITILPPVFGLKSFEVNIILSAIAKSVVCYFGIPFALALISRYAIIKLNTPNFAINLSYWFKKKYFKPCLINI